MDAELKIDEGHRYRLDVPADTYVRLRVTPGDAGGLTVRVVAPGDRAIVEAAGVRNEFGGVVAFVAPEAGRYRVVVQNSAVAPTSYLLEMEQVRPARREDLDRAAAERFGAEAARLVAADGLERALAALGKALEHWRRTGDVARVAEILIDIANLQAAASPDAALAHCREALEIATSAGLAEWRVEALNWMGTILLNQKQDCEGARVAYEEGRSIARETEDPRRAAIVGYNLAAMEKRCGTPERAVAAFEDLAVLARAAGDPGGEAIALRELAVLARRTADIGAARGYLDQAWRRAEESGNLEVQADVSHERGNLDRREGRLEDALSNYRRCLDLNERLGHQDRVVAVLLSLGALALDLRQPEEAWRYLNRALPIAESLGDLARQADILRELGATWFLRGDPVRAEESFRRALTAAEGLEGRRSRSRRLATVRVGLGNALLKTDRPGEAVAEFSAALEGYRSIDDGVGEALARRGLGTGLGRLGDTASALEQLTAALDLSRRQGEPLRTAWSLYRLAEVENRRDPDRALVLIREAIDISRRVRSDLSMDHLKAGFSEAPRRLYDLHLALLVDSGDPKAAFVVSEEGRARALLDLLAEARVDLAAGVDPALVAESRALDARIAWIQTELRDAVAAQRPEETRVAALRSQLERAEEEWWRVEAAMRDISPRYRELRDPPIEGVEQVGAALPPGRALLEYWLGEEGSFVFVVTRDSFDLVRLPAAPEIHGLVTAFRSAVVDLEPRAAFATKAYRLYRELVAPALAAAAAVGPIHELVIVADGPLHLMPFESLVTAPPEPGAGFQDLAFLIGEAAISYAPSATVLASLGRARASRRDGARGEVGPRFLAFADPRYDRPLALDCPTTGEEQSRSPAGAAPIRGRRLEALPGSRREVQAIAARYGRRARVYLGADASEDRIKSDPDLAVADRIHFAVHGVVCESFAERSGLVFTLDGRADQDGILQIREIFSLDLSADLVVLSACETGLGRLVSGEGVVGLARAFFHSGAPSLVVSLWQVSDRSTARLMASFYEHLDGGDDKAEALRNAQLDLIGENAAPFHWAPFILVGSREVN